MFEHWEDAQDSGDGRGGDDQWQPLVNEKESDEYCRGPRG